MIFLAVYKSGRFCVNFHADIFWVQVRPLAKSEFPARTSNESGLYCFYIIEACALVNVPFSKLEVIKSFVCRFSFELVLVSFGIMVMICHVLKNQMNYS